MPRSVSIPFQPMPQPLRLMPIRTSQRPDEKGLMQRIVRWIGAHVQSPLRESLQEYIGFGAASLTVVDATEPDMAGFLCGVRSIDEATPLPMDGVRWCIMIGARGIMVPPFLHLWFGRIAAHVLHADFGEPVCDGLTLLADPRFVAPVLVDAYGRVHMRQHLRLVASMNEPGQVRITCLGMHALGLPDLEIASCPADAVGPAEMFMVSTAQHLLAAAVGHMQQLDAKSAPACEALEVPERFFVTAALLEDATDMAAPSHTEQAALRLAFVPGDGTPYGTIHISAADIALEESGAWVLHAERQIFPSIGASVEMVPVGDAPPPQRDLVAELSKAPAEVRAAFLGTVDQPAAMFVKCPFPQTETCTEFMWVAVRTWEDGKVAGQLVNQSMYDDQLVAGLPVSFAEAELTAWRLEPIKGDATGGPIVHN